MHFSAAILLFVLLLATIAPADELDPAARLPQGDSASEYWDIIAETDAGHRIVARFGITNFGPSRRNGVAVGHLIDPDGKTAKFRNGRMKRRWTLSSDRLKLDIGGSHLDLHAPRPRLEIDKSHLRFDVVFDLGSGAQVPAALTGEDYRIDLLALGAPADITIFEGGRDGRPSAHRGRATLIHSEARKAEAEIVTRRSEMLLQREDLAIYLLEWLTPLGEEKSWLAFETSKPIGALPVGLHTSDRTGIELSDLTQDRDSDGSKNAYWIPRTIALESPQIRGSVQVGEAFLRHDPLTELPGPVRFLVGISMKPRRLWSDAGFAVTLRASSEPSPLPHQGKDARQIRGQGVAAISFLNPPTPP